MSLSKINFTKLWTNPSDFPAIRTAETDVRNDMQYLFDELKDGVNDIVDEIEGTSGASNLGIDSISGLSADNVQDALEEINSDLGTHTSNTSNPHSVTKAQVGLGNVDNKSEATIKNDFRGYISRFDSGFVIGGEAYMALDEKVTKNNSIQGATKCKVTYDSKGLVTGGADLSASDIPNLDASKITSGTLGTSRIPSLDASKITSGTLGTDRIPSLDANKVTSGTFADARIASASTWNGKQDALVSGTNIKTINNESILGSGNLSIDTSKVKWARRNETSASQIAQWISQGYVVFCKYAPSSNIRIFTFVCTFAKTGFEAGHQVASAEFLGKDGDKLRKISVSQTDDTTTWGSPSDITISASDIPDLPASKITSGTFADARIASASTWNGKQDALVSGTNIKTINNESILGSGNLSIDASNVKWAVMNETSADQIAQWVNSGYAVFCRYAPGSSVLYYVFVCTYAKTGYVGETTTIQATARFICSKGDRMSKIEANQWGSTTTWSNAPSDVVLNHEVIPSLDASKITSGTFADARIASSSTWNGKQDALVSGTNIKTINNQSVLGSGNIEIAGGSSVWGQITGTLSNQTDLNTALQSKYVKPASGIPASDLESGVIPTVPTNVSAFTNDAGYITDGVFYADFDTPYADLLSAYQNGLALYARDNQTNMYSPFLFVMLGQFYFGRTMVAGDSSEIVYTTVMFHCEPSNGWQIDSGGDYGYIPTKTSQLINDSGFLTGCPTTTDGEFILKCTVLNGVATYTWVSAN